MRFLADQDTFQAKLIQSLENDPFYAPFVLDTAIARNRRLIALWDRLSLNICWGVSDPMTIDQVPMANGSGSIMVTPVSGETDSITIDPWPFAQTRVELIFEGRLLEGRYATQSDLMEALDRAPWRSIVAVLRQA